MHSLLLSLEPVEKSATAENLANLVGFAPIVARVQDNVLILLFCLLHLNLQLARDIYRQLSAQM